MMSKSIAMIALAIIQIGLMLGNYWFTFGLWPKSWSSFIFFAISSITILTLMDIIRKEE